MYVSFSKAWREAVWEGCQTASSRWLCGVNTCHRVRSELDGRSWWLHHRQSLSKNQYAWILLGFYLEGVDTTTTAAIQRIHEIHSWRKEQDWDVTGASRISVVGNVYFLKLSKLQTAIDLCSCHCVRARYIDTLGNFTTDIHGYCWGISEGHSHPVVHDNMIHFHYKNTKR